VSCVTFASDSTLSWWALSLLALPLLYKLLQHSGYIEILALAGLFLIFTSINTHYGSHFVEIVHGERTYDVRLVQH
jgi:hypothetical protein